MKFKFFLFFIVIISYNLQSQDFNGFNQSNYAGVSGVYQQPASIVDSRMKFDMNLIGLNLGFYNTYFRLKGGAFRLPKGSDFKDIDSLYLGSVFDYHNVIADSTGSRDHNIYFSNRIAMPSFMVSINRKNAIALTWNIRTYVNVDGLSSDLANLTYNELNYPSIWVTNLQNKNLSIQEMSWAEYGLTYARVLKEDNEHYLKAGATVKLLRGIQSAYMFIKDLNYNVKNADTASIFKSTVNYGHSSNFEFGGVGLNGNSSTFSFDYTQSYPGFGFDIGFVYEWRPNYQSYKYDMDGEKGLWRNDQNKYKLKVGISATDIGSIKFKKGSTSGDFTANVNFWNIHNLQDIKSVGELDDTLNNRFGISKTASSYKMNLPTAFSAQIDYQIWKDVYVNLTPYIAMQFKNNDTKVHDWSSISLTPRWDHKWFGVFIPVQYNFLNGFRYGTALRLGPLVVGTTNLMPLLSKKDQYGADLYTMLKIPIPYGKPKDKDKDGISNKKDLCKDEPGVWEFMGCPDKDGDHIKDSEDKCPDVAGVKELQGCPDRDLDGITDLEDKCPDDKGVAEFQGCPDTDGDNIIDKEDECPTDAGLEEFMGCPDRDGDKTPDKYDACPDVAGPKEYKGCPDKDGDTVLDKDDECPEIVGAAENKGCPWPDTDKDGVADREDDCPTIPGQKELKGCPPAPVLKAEEQKILEKAFSSLEFATGKDIIKKTSFPSLNELAGLMKQHAADWTLKLSGHTDNQGDAAKNMLLSEKRAKAVKKYLVAKGVKADRIITEWFGPNVPIADNGTEAGRQKNRRVEMKVQFK